MIIVRGVLKDNSPLMRGCTPLKCQFTEDFEIFGKSDFCTVLSAWKSKYAFIARPKGVMGALNTNAHKT